MMQILEDVFARFTAWMAADPHHAEMWLGIGLGLAIAAIALLAAEQLEARAATEHH